ncbi:MAG: DUF5615 family PIN-like protein [Dehalococcoidia bacterium]|nr:DUF5615 family PIN-like protein [Dehalococcoidia bacterium]
MTAVRFMLDEHIHKGVAAGLRREGIESATVHELGRRTASDASHLEFGRQAGWVLVTFDGRLVGLATAMPEHAGVVLGRDQVHSVGQLVRSLAAIAAAQTMESFRSRVPYL